MQSNCTILCYLFVWKACFQFAAASTNATNTTATGSTSGTDTSAGAAVAIAVVVWLIVMVAAYFYCQWRRRPTRARPVARPASKQVGGIQSGRTVLHSLPVDTSFHAAEEGVELVNVLPYEQCSGTKRSRLSPGAVKNKPATGPGTTTPAELAPSGPAQAQPGATAAVVDTSTAKEGSRPTAHLSERRASRADAHKDRRERMSLARKSVTEAEKKQRLAVYSSLF